ncbi:OPT oligopeptide transporter protein-domain-containing protein [Clohesyomyces aquaticus]|uniref:OPT oligopeptide transporter protein-domain-containing protein n=1 Tax=Clohesyomyces aquaticus TaxID=1231657 RepID=A0A1Y1YRL5_9PLEO|nr:OPT oligopeptide transporter protein-domain-containing protein [Clohesyomyces aquaticus]
MANLFRRFRRNADQDSGHSEEANPTTVTANPEKNDPEIAVARDSHAFGENEDDLPDDVRELPKVVRNIVSLEDQVDAPTITFRYFILCFIFVPPGAILYTMGVYRTTASAYPILFVQIASHYVGEFLAEILPHKTIRVPFTKFSFSLNPGPWNSKENVLVTLTAASGATGNAAWSAISLAQIYYDTHIPVAVALFFMWAIVYIGYGMAALARQFLLYDPIYTWPYSLMQTAVFESLRKSGQDSRVARKQKIVFFSVFVFCVFWHFLPEYVFPFLSSLSFLCWVAPRNPVANFIGAGIGGMGFLNLSLDWSNISNQSLTSPMITPFWTTGVLTVAFILNCWVLLPAAKWGGLGEWKNDQLMSNRVFLANGTKYPAKKLIGPNFTFNETAYQELGPIYMGTQAIWSLFFDYSSYISALTWMALFGWPKIKDTIGKLRERAKSRGTDTINHFYTDRLNVIQRSYKEVPLWWYLALFLASFVTILTILAKGYFFIPVWTFFVAIVTSGFMILPFSWLYSFSAFQVPIGSFNELLYGYMVHAVGGHKHPAGANAYGCIAGDIWYRAQYMLQDQKIGHYMHVPPRAVFFSQIFGELIGIPINYGIIQWVLKEKREFLLGDKIDPLGQWTGQQLSSYNTMGVQYVLIGPKRLFEQHMYKPLPWAFFYGAVAPAILYALHRMWPKSKLKFHLWNVTIFGVGVSQFYGNLSTGYLSRFIVGYVCMRWFLRHRFETWRRYNYLIAAALDAGFNIAMLLMFIIFSSGKVIKMPYWWGNNEDSVERCFALET